MGDGLGLALEAELVDPVTGLVVPDTSYSQGTVTAVSPTTGTCTVAFSSGTEVANVGVITPEFPAVGDSVWLTAFGTSYAVSGILFNPAGGALTGLVGYTRATSAPPGWLICNGGAIASQYTGLIALVGSNTPDLRNKSPIGSGSTYTNGTGYGNATATLTSVELPSHSHTLSHTHDISHTHSIGSGTNVSATGAVRQEPSSSATATSSGPSTTTSGGASSTTTSTTGSGTAFSLLHPVLGLLPIIHV